MKTELNCLGVEMLTNEYLEQLMIGYSIETKCCIRLIDTVGAFLENPFLISALVEALVVSGSDPKIDRVGEVVDILSIDDCADDIMYQLKLNQMGLFEFIDGLIKSLKPELKLHRFMPVKLDLENKWCYVIVPDM